MAIYALENPVQKYDWGSPTTLPSLLGKENPSGEPWAELWMGAHPKSPSIAVDPISGTRTPLDALVRSSPDALLGEDVASRFGGALPFLLKILCAAKPLSIQAHPDKRKAEHGFAREEFQGIPVDAPERNYKDPNHKPETVVALEPFEGMCGFRPVDEIVSNIKLVSPNNWERFAGRLAREPSKLELSVFFYTFVSLADDTKAKYLAYVRARIERIAASEAPAGPMAKAFSWVLRLMDAYPGDVGALAPLVLNLFELAPGQALNLSAGEAHAYLRGTAVEIMANSDNVLRGGLTRKHVDLPEFISALGFDIFDALPLEAGAPVDGFMGYPCDVPDYAIARADVSGRLEVGARRKARRESGKGSRGSAPEILLCTEGDVTLSTASASIPLLRGAAAFVGADEGAYALEGRGRIFRASVPG